MRKRGEVYIAPDAPVPADGSMIDPAIGEFWASWQDEEAEGLVEDVLLQGAERAITWRRERSGVVLIRLGHRDDTYFSAGEERVVDDTGEPLPLWPPPGPPPSGWWDPETGHTDAPIIGKPDAWNLDNGN